MIKVDGLEKLTIARKRLVDENNWKYGEAFAALTAGYPPEEVATFGKQEAESAAWAADPQAPTPWIDTAAAIRGVPREIYLQRTRAKALQFSQASSFLTGRRQRIDDAIKVATTMQALEAITIDYTLPGAP